jgi:metal-responsive CopG/Arc/MetJ family transcriptional regulator
VRTIAVEYRSNAVDRKNTKITVILPAEEFDRFDSYCQEQGFKKSTLIARLIRDHLDSSAHRLQRELPIQAGSEKHSKG